MSDVIIFVSGQLSALLLVAMIASFGSDDEE